MNTKNLQIILQDSNNTRLHANITTTALSGTYIMDEVEDPCGVDTLQGNLLSKDPLILMMMMMMLWWLSEDLRGETMHVSSITLSHVTYDGIAHDPKSTYNAKPVEGHVTGL